MFTNLEPVSFLSFADEFACGLGNVSQVQFTSQLDFAFFFFNFLKIMCFQGLISSQECLANLDPLQSFLRISSFVHVRGLLDYKV